MATTFYDFTPVTTGPRTASSPLSLLTVATIVSKVAYQPGDGTNDKAANTIGWEYVVPLIAYTKGDETSLRCKVELYDGTTWWPALFKATQTASYSAITVDYLEFSATTSGALVPVSVLGFQAARMSFIANGGTPTGTVGYSFVAGCTVKR